MHIEGTTKNSSLSTKARLRRNFAALGIVAGNNVAFIHSLERISGTLKSGQKSEVWVRATSGLRKINGKWLIVHDHISLPVNLEAGKAALDLKP